MIEREFIKDKIKNLNIRDRINTIIRKGAGCGTIIIEKTPVGEKIIIHSVRPGLVIGRAGETIRSLTAELKSKYHLENPQIEVKEITIPHLNARSVAKNIVSDLERFGSSRFKSVGHRTISNIIKAGAMGAEITISGKLPGKRAKTWRFADGYMKKCGNVSDELIDTCIESANLKSGVVGINVKIMLPNTPLPDKFKIIKLEQESLNEIKEIKKEPLKKVELEVEKKAPVKKEDLAEQPRGAEVPPTDESKIRGTTERSSAGTLEENLQSKDEGKPEPKKEIKKKEVAKKPATKKKVSKK